MSQNSQFFQKYFQSDQNHILTFHFISYSNENRSYDFRSKGCDIGMGRSHLEVSSDHMSACVCVNILQSSIFVTPLSLSCVLYQQSMNSHCHTSIIKKSSSFAAHYTHAILQNSGKITAITSNNFATVKTVRIS